MLERPSFCSKVIHISFYDGEGPLVAQPRVFWACTLLAKIPLCIGLSSSYIDLYIITSIFLES